MDIGGLIAKLLLVSAANAYGQKKAQEAMPQITEMVEQYYMTFFGEIFLSDERNWILNQKIKPIVARMNGKELADILKIMDKNNKLVAKNKPIKKELVDRKTIQEYHLEYQRVKAKEEEEKRRASARANEEIRIKRNQEIERERSIARMRAEKERRWNEYIENFKKYNGAQKRAELEWFKNKLANNFVNNQNEKDLYIHELEMIMLEDEK